MWAIRILNGPRAGEVLSLKEGATKIGRSQTVDIQINAGGVSKEHLEISMNAGALTFNDLNSSNGTFLNGTRVKSGTLKLGDKVGIHNIMFDIVVSNEKLQEMAAQKAQRAQVPAAPVSIKPANIPAQMPAHPPMQAPMQNANFNLPTYPQQPQGFPNQSPSSQGMPSPAVHKPSLVERVNSFVENVVMVGFYQLTETLELKMVMMSFVAIFIAMVTLLAIIPMKQITTESVVNESKKRAMTVARSLARGNEKVLKTGEIAQFSTEYALREDGVEDVYVVSKDGRILAPPERTGAAPKEMSFFRNQILKAGTHEASGEVGDKIAAAVPIIGYDTDTQKNIAKAYAVIIYNPGNLMYDDGKVFGLFIQMLAFGLLAGGVLFFLMFKLVEYPFQQLNKELDLAMREEKTQIEVKVKLPILHDLATNLNSLIARLASPGGGGAGQMSAGARNHEYINIISLIASPALLISVDGTIIKCSRFFEDLTGVRPDQVENRKVSELEQGLQRNIEALMAQSHSASAQVAQDNYEFNSGVYALNCQAVTLPTGEVDCYFLVMTPAEGNASVA